MDMQSDIDVFPVRRATQAQLDQWKQLAHSALEPCPYLTPEFILPLLEYVSTDAEPYIVAVRESASSAYDALAIIESCRPTRQVPMKHERVFSTIYSPSSGFLLSKDDSGMGAARLMLALKTHRASTGPLWLSSVRTDGGQWDRVLASAHGVGAVWWPYQETKRAILKPKESGEDYIANRLPRKIQSELRRNFRRLQEQGNVAWRFRRGAELSGTEFENFLRLENMGWKGDKGTAIAADPLRIDFLRKVVDSLGVRNDVFFTELMLDGNVIASTLNFIAGNYAFGFKLGWDPSYSKYGIGILNLRELIRQSPLLLSDIELMDSCAAPGNFIYKLWLDRYTISNGVFTFGRPQGAIVGAVQRLRALKARIQRPNDTPAQSSRAPI